MSYVVSFSAEAERQVLDLFRWQRETLGETAEAKASAAVDRLVASLQAMPHRYRRYELTKAKIQFRVAVAYFHKFFFVIDDSTTTVEIVAVYHEKSDSQRIATGLSNLR